VGPTTRIPPEAVARRQQRAESRAQLIERLSNPLLTLQETSLLLNVCPATVRRWSNSGSLPHVRTEGNQRRFRWRDVQLLMPEASLKRRA
jgi:excisionase family DNA binding protein